MADDVLITEPGSGRRVLADERTIAAVLGLIQRVDEIGASAIATGQVGPTTTAATLLAARETRKVVTFVNFGSVDVYVGPATVTTANGMKIAPGASFDMRSTALVQAVTAAGTGAIHYLEVYDS